MCGELGLGLGVIGCAGASSSRNCLRSISGAKGSIPVFRNPLKMVFFKGLSSDRVKCVQDLDFVEFGAAGLCRLLSCPGMVVLKRLEHIVERL